MEQFLPLDQLNVSTLILAGGKSRRMGRDKALLEVRGQPLLQSLCLMAQACTKTVYVVTPWGDRYRSILPQNCDIIPEILPEGQSESPGPLRGFLQGLPYIQTPWCLLLACDLPYLTLNILEQWLTLLRHIPPEAIAALPQHPKGWEPLCGFYRRQCLASGKAFVRQGGRSFQKWLAPQNIYSLPLDDSQCLFNCNTPEDFAQLATFYP